MRQLAAGRHEQELYIGRRGRLNGARDIIYREVRRDKAQHDGGAARHIVKLAQPLRRQLPARKIGGLYIPAPHGAEVRKWRTHFCVLLVRRCLRCQRLCLDPVSERNLLFFLIPKQTKHNLPPHQQRLFNISITQDYPRRKKR